MVFENFFTSIKNKTKKLSNSFANLKNKPQKTTSSNYYTVSSLENNDLYENDYLSPRAISMNYNSQWPTIMENMSWNPYVPPSLDEHNIVDRFIRVITIDAADDVRSSKHALIHNCLPRVIFACG